MAGDAKHCPLCHQPNLCAVANDKNAEDCWCRYTPISPELIARARRQTRERYCICQACAEQALRLADELKCDNKHSEEAP